MWKKTGLLSIAMLFTFSIILAGCGNSNSDTGNNSSNSKETKSETKTKLGKKDLTIAYVSWESAVASNNVMKQVLENVGYDVTLKQVQTGGQYAGVAGGSVDALIDAWLPTTDKSYWDRYKDKVTDLGISLKSAPEGLVVPKYMKNINSVKDLAKDTDNVGEKTDWTVTGIDAGAGEMEIIRKKMFKQYGLNKKWDLKASSSSAMLATLKKAEKNHKPIVTVLWSPHWAFSQWDLKFLKDPKDVFEKPDDVHTLARKGFKDDYPAATKVFKQFHWKKKDLEKVMAMIHKGMKPEEAAKKWISNHQDLVNKWTKGVK